MDQTNRTSLFEFQRIERREFINRVGAMLTLAVMGALVADKVSASSAVDDDSWAGDYRGV